MSVAYETYPLDDATLLAAPAVASLAPPPYGPPPVLAAQSAHVRLLASVAAFTHHRDIDALDHSLALSLAELASARAVSLCKRTHEDGSRPDSVVRCAADAHGAYGVTIGELASTDPACAPLRRCMESLSTHADRDARGQHRLFVPIVHEGRALGALLLEGEASLESARPLADGFAHIYANYITLLNESERDKLTGLYNRRTFERHLQRLFRRPARIGSCVPIERRVQPAPDTPVWLAIFDIDHFKRINDTYGHIYGDEVILLLAQQMRASFRHHDVLFRFGGEEFVVLLTDTDETDARAALERFRGRVAQHLFPQVGHVTVSVGYARACLTDYPETVIDRADKALYFAKQNGRNRTHGYEALVAAGALGEAPVATGSIDLF